MPTQLHPIAQAAAFLTTGPGTSKEKLILGSKLIWAAKTLSGDWAPNLLERANSICRGLMTDGTVQRTVEQMDESTADKRLKQFREDTVELAAAIEQVRSQARPHR
jgi:hypothetical protein